jgi:hypothetical protein
MLMYLRSSAAKPKLSKEEAMARAYELQKRLREVGDK